MSTSATAERKRYAAARVRARTRRSRRPSFELRMMAPALIVLALLSLFPFFYIIAMSLSRVHLIGGIHLGWLGLGNWTRLFSDPIVGASWLRAIEYFVSHRRLGDGPRRGHRADAVGDRARPQCRRCR